jgi:hypothetical protein
LNYLTNWQSQDIQPLLKLAVSVIIQPVTGFGVKETTRNAARPTISGVSRLAKNNAVEKETKHSSKNYSYMYIYLFFLFLFVISC